jgi:hypothetical protein
MFLSASPSIPEDPFLDSGAVIFHNIICDFGPCASPTAYGRQSLTPLMTWRSKKSTVTSVNAPADRT